MNSMVSHTMSSDALSYSVVIRTLGTTDEKYRRMLEAIDKQTIKPQEIIVVIPNGYKLDHELGNERVVYSEKGMVTQRAVGIQEAKSKYLLVLDDDLVFPNDFVERLYDHLMQNDLDCVLAFGGADDDGNPQAQKTKTSIREILYRFRGMLTGQYFYSHLKSNYYDVITRTAGHRTYVNERDKLCQTGCFQCFFIKKEAATEVHLEEELWLEQGTLSQYAAFDDTVFFYKLFVAGHRFAYTSDTAYLHLDAGAGRYANDKVAAKRIRLYSVARNRTVFWKRFVLPHRPGILTWMGGIYGLGNYALYSTIINLHPKNWPAISALFAGYRDAFRLLSPKK